MRPATERGFTLIEVLVSLAILLLVTGVFLSASWDSVRGAAAAARVEDALIRARSRLAMTETNPAEGDFRGEDGSGFHWRVRTAQIGRWSGQGLPVTQYATTVWISWNDGSRAREVHLNARHLFTPPPREPTRP